MRESFKLTKIEIGGFRPFGHFQARLGPLEVLVGANGSGKSSLFEFLRFLRDSMSNDIPPEIVPGSLARSVFHSPRINPMSESFSWMLHIEENCEPIANYGGSVFGPVGRPLVANELVTDGLSEAVMSEDEEGRTFHWDTENVARHISRPNDRLALSLMTSTEAGILYQLRRFLASARFYSSFLLANDKLRQPVLIEQQPVLREDCGNLSALLHYLMTEHGQQFLELQQHLKAVVPGFQALTVKARGGPGEVIAFWKEEGVDADLPLADLSDGILRLLCWLVICLHPNPPPLICIDEPDQGVHPRTLPVLAGLFEKASERTQILLATHSSFFLTQFPISRIAVLRKENGEAKFHKPADSAVLTSALEDFGPEEIEVLHRSDELERYA